MHSSRESVFQADLIDDLRRLFPGCLILKNDPNYLQGVPDILILWGHRWAALECKAGPVSRKQPNQSYYMDLMDDWSFAAFIFPENKNEVLSGLQRSLEGVGPARVSQR